MVKGRSKSDCDDTLFSVLLKPMLDRAPHIDFSPIMGGVSYTERQLEIPWGAIFVTFCAQVPGGGKDLTGFIDGTVNPDETLRASINMATRPDGSSHVFAAKFVHNIQSFWSLNASQRNSIIGRNHGVTCQRKSSDGRFENPRSGPGVGDKRGHVFRAWGDMLRHAMPFYSGQCPVVGNSTEEHCPVVEQRCGLYFVAATRDPSQIDEALRRMCGHYATEMDDGIFFIL